MGNAVRLLLEIIMEDKILEFVGKVITYGGGFAAIFYGLLRLFGQKWLDEKFSKRLEEFKRFQKQEFENYRFEINKIFNRVVKIHEKEFEVLPTAWEKLQLAHGLVSQMTSPLQSYPDIDKMSEDELKSFLENSKLYDFQKKELMQAYNRLDYYKEKIFWIKYNEVANTIMDFHNYILLNKIFFNKNMFDLFSDIDSKLYESHLLSSELANDERSTEVWKNLREANKNIQPLINDLEKVIQNKMHFNDAV